MVGFIIGAIMGFVVHAIWGSDINTYISVMTDAVKKYFTKK